MLAGIIQTIIMALGIATGNVSSNVYKGGNVFNESEKSQPTKKAIENINLEYDTGRIKSSYYEYQTQEHNYYVGYEKYYLKPYGSSIENGDQYYQLTDFGIIYNSIYTMSRPVGNLYVATTIAYLKIHIYNNGYNHYKLTKTLIPGINGWVTDYKQCRISQDPQADELLDLTMTANTYNQIDNIITKPYWTMYESTNTTDQISSGTEISYEPREITIDQGETLYVVISIASVQNGNTDQSIQQYGIKINITGQYVETQINYEIVDIPGLMFTVLSMPFSFISTAFNLTIFPNTPYQINFSNLFMVILAAFILMWIIKKVFH